MTPFLCFFFSPFFYASGQQISHQPPASGVTVHLPCHGTQTARADEKEPGKCEFVLAVGKEKNCDTRSIARRRRRRQETTGHGIPRAT